MYEQLDASKPVKVHATHIGDHNPYTGTPGQKTGEAWKSLLRGRHIDPVVQHRIAFKLKPGLGYNIRVPRQLLQPGQDSIPLSDGSDDVVGSLGVYHYLHCLVSTPHPQELRCAHCN